MYTGLRKPYIAEYNEATGVYSNGFLANKGVEAVVTPNFNTLSYAGDDEIQKEKHKFKDATFTAKVTKLPIAAASVMFGHTVSGLEIKYNTDDESNYVGYGFTTTVVNDAADDTYKAIVIPKVKFMDTAETFATNGDSITVNADAIEGKALVNLDGDWLIEKEFDTFAEAEAYVKVTLNITTQSTTPVPDVEPGTYASTQTVSLVAGSGETIYYTTDGLTPDETSTEYTGAITVASSTMIRAIATAAGQLDSEVADLEYIITV